MEYAYHIKTPNDRNYDQLLQLTKQGLQPICKEYLISSVLSGYYGVLSALLIFVFNVFIILISDPMIQMIGLHHRTTERMIISCFLSASLVFNSMLVPILLQANFSRDYPGSYMDFFFSAGGRNSDFGSTWYQDIGSQLAVTLSLLSLTPILMVFIDYYSYKMKLAYTQKLYKNHANNQTDNIKFLELNAGPNYNHAVKSASLNCVLFMTLSLSPAFPIFYALGIFAISIQYVVERYSSARLYRLPQKVNLDLTQANIYVLAGGALFNCCLTFWLMGNTHMFSSGGSEKLETIHQVTQSHHHLGDAIANALAMRASPSEQLSFAGIITLLSLFCLLFICKFVCCKFVSKTPLTRWYLESLREQDLHEIVEEEKVFLHDLHTQNMSEQNLMKIDKVIENLQLRSKAKRQVIQGEPYFSVYNNFDYWMRFNLAYLHEERNAKLLL